MRIKKSMKSLINLIMKWFKGKQDYLCLKRYPVFRGLSHFELNLIYQMFHRREFHAGDVVFEQGFPLEVVYFIESGKLEVSGVPQLGGSRILNEGEYIGLIDMFHEKIRSSSAKATEESVLLAISRTDLQDFINGRLTTGVKILNNTCSELSGFIFQIADTLKTENGPN